MRIVLVRHGKPINANNNKLNASGFANWVRRYNHSVVSPHSQPDHQLFQSFSEYFAVSSDLPRAVHSCQLAVSKFPELESSVFREMEIPRYRLPFHLNAWTWVYFNRALWMLGVKGSFESYVQARARAKLGAKKLIDLASEKQNIIVFSHGYLNLHMRNALRQYGFKQLTKSNDYWGVSILEK